MRNCKKSVLSLTTALLALTGGSVAQADTMPLGYCNVTDNPTGTLSDNTTGVWSSGAIFIPASTASTISGCRITGLRFGVQLLLNIDAAKVWVRTSLEGEDLATVILDADSDQKLVRGWNEVAFDEPWTVPDDCEGFYLGYSVHQKGYSYGITNSPAACENAFFVNIAEKGWENLSDQGSLYLQATVEGDNLPAVNAGIASCALDKQFFLNKTTLSGTFRVHNLGSQTLSRFNVSLLDDDNELASTSVTADIKPGESKELPVSFTPQFPGTGTYDVTLRIDGIAEGDDADPADNVRTQTVHVMERSLERVVLVEEFSTESCHNCPRGTALVQSIMKRPANEGRIAAVIHHSGYGTDYFTRTWDTDYLWFFNGTEHTPTFMVDRYAGMSSIPIVEEADFDAAVTARLKDEPVLQLEMQAGFDIIDDSRLVVVVKGVKFSRDPICAEPYITLWLTEDNVTPRNQAGASGDYKHQHLARAVNSSWGLPVEFEGDSFEYKYVFEGVNPDWKKENLTVVGAIHNRKGSDRTAMNVANACFVAYDSFEPMSDLSGVATVAEGDGDAAAEYFTLSGVKVGSDNLAPGLYIRRSGAKTAKILVR